jgi:outer membrane protein OmpA-like peptidoglycan-associated protein
MKRFRIANFAFLLIFLVAPLQSFKIKTEEVFAMVSGELTAFTKTGTQIKSIHIKVIEEKSGKVQLRTYSPQGEKGKYYMLLSPDKKYQLEVSPEGYLPYKIDLYIPENTCRYELGYNLELENIELLGEVIGQNASLKQVYKHLKLGTDLSPDQLRVIEDDFMLDLIDYVMESGNTHYLKRLEKFAGSKIQTALQNKKVIEDGKKEEEKDPFFDEMFASLDAAFEEENTDSSSLAEVASEILDTETPVKTQTSFYDIEQSQISTRMYPSSQKTNMLFSTDKILMSRYFITFSQKQNKLDNEQKEKLQEIANFINSQSGLRMDLFGHATSNDTKQKLKKQVHLSQKRTQQVFKFLNEKITDSEKIYTITYALNENRSDNTQVYELTNTRELFNSVEILIFKPN